jgi:hypothetical protein
MEGKVKIKVKITHQVTFKVVPSLAMKAYGGVELQAHIILIFDGWLTKRTDRFTQPVPINL